MALVDVDFTRFRSNHPSPGDFRRLVPQWPNSDAYKETCCGQISYAFNKSGAPISHYDYPNKHASKGKVRVFTSRATGENYLLAVHDAYAYLVGSYGEPEVFENKNDLVSGIGSRQGIVAFGFRHMDVWSNGSIHFQSIYNMSVLWNRANWLNKKLMFWEVDLDMKEFFGPQS